MKKSKFPKIILILTLCVALLGFTACGKDEGEIDGDYTPNSSETSSESESLPESSESSSDTVIIVGDPSSEESSEESSEPESSESSSEEAPSEAPVEDVAVTDPMKEYFKTAVFLGNSRTQGLQLYTGLTETTFLAERSMTVKQYDTKDYFTLANGNKGTALQVLQEKTFDSVYIMYGLNEIGWPNSNAFFNAYRALIEDVKASQPNAVIYVQSILPVSKKVSDENEYVNNPRIDAYNETLSQIAAEMGVNFVDVNSSFKDESGHLPASVSTDGVHFGPKSCKKWLEILYNNR